ILLENSDHTYAWTRLDLTRNRFLYLVILLQGSARGYSVIWQERDSGRKRKTTDLILY
ncbi:hypothetical protein CP8484711_1113, partial [Chlamydia psittaci 84-8471/1]